MIGNTKIKTNWHQLSTAMDLLMVITGCTSGFKWINFSFSCSSPNVVGKLPKVFFCYIISIVFSLLWGYDKKIQKKNWHQLSTAMDLLMVITGCTSGFKWINFSFSCSSPNVVGKLPNVFFCYIISIVFSLLWGYDKKIQKKTNWHQLSTAMDLLMVITGCTSGFKWINFSFSCSSPNVVGNLQNVFFCYIISIVFSLLWG